MADAVYLLELAAAEADFAKAAAALGLLGLAELHDAMAEEARLRASSLLRRS